MSGRSPRGHNDARTHHSSVNTLTLDVDNYSSDDRSSSSREGSGCERLASHPIVCVDDTRELADRVVADVIVELKEPNVSQPSLTAHARVLDSFCHIGRRPRLGPCQRVNKLVVPGLAGNNACLESSQTNSDCWVEST